MALWIRDTSSVPDGGWRYPHVAPGQFIVKGYHQLYEEIVKVYTANNQPVPSREEVTEWMCRELHIPCVDGNEPLINKFSLGLPVPAPAGCCK